MVSGDRQMKLRVALVALYPPKEADSQSAPGVKSPGGVRAVVQNLVRGLQAYADLQIHVIHCHADIRESATVYEASPSGDKENGVQIHYIAMPRRRLVPNTLMSIVRVERLLRQLQPDVVNTHAAHYTLAALRAGYPTIFTIHGVVQREAEVYTSTLFDRTRFGLEMWLERHALQAVRDIVAISPYVLEEYRYRSNARFHRIDNPLSAEFFAVPDLAEEGRLLYAGTIDERKNVLDLLRAMAVVRQKLAPSLHSGQALSEVEGACSEERKGREGVPNVCLRIAGRTTNPGYYRKAQKFVAEQGLQRHVEFLGLQDRAHLLDEYARCAAVVLASRQETAPMAVIEAMAAGKPVIATRVGGVPDLIEDGSSGLLVEPGDVEGLARCILELLADRELRRRMGQRARQLAARFRLETVAAEYRRLYYAVAGKPMPHLPEGGTKP